MDIVIRGGYVVGYGWVSSIGVRFCLFSRFIGLGRFYRRWLFWGLFVGVVISAWFYLFFLVWCFVGVVVRLGRSFR